MSTDDLAFATTRELAERLRRREVSPVELTRLTLERAERLNRSLNCFITICADEALAEARQAEREIMAGGSRGPLHGIPYSVKDLYATKGIRTTAGSKVLADFVPDEDATAVARLRAAGAVLFAKCNTSEFAAGPTTKNIHWGTARNPWNREHITGGSSGGSGAAVAAGIGAFSMGSDTGGSVRIPAAANGTVGLKPTYGRASKYGVNTLAWTLDTVGPLSRSVEDSALVLEIIAGRDPKDSTTSRRPVERYSAEIGADVRGMRVGVPKEHYWSPLHPDVEPAVRAAIDKLGALGAEIVEVSIPWVSQAFHPANMISWVESSVYHRTWRDRWATDYGEELLQRCLIGSAISGRDYLLAQEARRAMVGLTRALFQRIDVLATPTSAIPAPPIEPDEVQVGPVREPMRSAMGRLCRLGSFTGFPAVAMPCGFSGEGLPISLQLLAGSFQEGKLIRVADAYERATEWRARRPSVE